MVLPALPPDYAPGDTPLADELNAIKAWAATGIDPLTTTLTRTLGQNITNNTWNTVSWQTVQNGRNGASWSAGAPTRITCPSGGGGLWSVVAGVQLEALNNTGFRQLQLLKNGTTGISGFGMQGSVVIYGVLSTAWDVEMVPGDYVELQVWQNSGVTLISMVGSSAPRISARRVAA